MNVRIKKTSGELVSYWGIEGTESTGSGEVLVYVPSDTDVSQIDCTERSVGLVVDGSIQSTTDTEFMSEQQLMQQLGRDALTDDTVHLLESEVQQYAWILEEFEMPDDANITVHGDNA